jgi:hypothetical protein
MGMGDWYLSTNQLRRIWEMIKILLWVECGPYVVYGKRE